MNLLRLFSLKICLFFFLWSNFLSALDLTDEEKMWIVEHPIVKVGAGPDWAPFDFSKNGKYIGIANEYLSLLSQKTGLEFDIKIDIWKNNLAKMKKQEIDLLPALYHTDKRAKYMHYTESYFEMLDYFFIRNDVNAVTMEDLNGKIVAIPEGYAHGDILRQEFPHIKILTVLTFSDAIDAVLEHRADILFDTYTAVMFVLKKEGTNTIVPFKSYRENETMKLYMASSQNNPILASIINKGLHEITEYEKENIRNKWVSINNGVVVDYTLVYQIIGLFLFFILGTWFWYRKLMYEVRKREQSEAQMTMLIDNIPLNVIVSSLDGKVLRANTFALKTFNISMEDMSQYNAMEFYADPLERDEIISLIQTEGKVNDRIIKFKRLDGSEMNIMMSIIPIIYDTKKALLSIMVDLSERIEMEENLRKAKKVADNANKSKSEFLANMSHEIRTPMNAIIGFTELLDEQVTKPRLKSYTKIIKNAGNSLLILINDILDLSKIEAGKLEIHKKAVNVRDIASDVTSIFSMSVGKKGLSIVLDMDDTIPESLLLDGIRLRQVLVNLVGNAVKFTVEGYIKLSIHAFNIDNHLSKLDLVISVEDTGIGIPSEQRESIFNSFEQQEGQDNRKFGGTGLGLSISKRLVEMMDGTITVQANEKKGATFFIHLYGVDISSIQMNELDTTEEDTKKIIFKPSKILIVDDIEDNRKLIINNFVDTSITIVTANDGLEAIAQYKKEKPDLILMDIRMPNMDGYDASREIRAISDVPIIALTASSMQDEYEESKSKYFNGYLRKPVLRKQLFIELSHFLDCERTNVVKKEDEVVGALILEDFAMQNLSTILNVLDDDIMPLYEKAVSSNSISDIQVFSVKVEDLVQKYNLEPLEEYLLALNEAIDSFDIVQIQSLLQEFSILEKKFKLL
jgi:two-component system sensor histidine kinase EvgS